MGYLKPINRHKKAVKIIVNEANFTKISINRE